MQNKKTLLHRLLVIYITFFIVLVASIAHNLLTDFSRGASEGFELGESIAEKWSSGTPRMIYVLNNIRITETPECPQTAPAGQPGCELDVRVSKIDCMSSRTPPEYRLSAWLSARSAAADGSMRW